MSTKNNQNAAHSVAPECKLNMRCVCQDKAEWKAAAIRQGFATLSPWIVATLNAAANPAEAFNQQYDVGQRFMFNGREVQTTCEAFERSGSLLVKITSREAGVLVSELRHSGHVAYVLVVTYPYEGANVLGVFHSPELAAAAKTEAVAADGSNGYNEFDIEEHTFAPQQDPSQ